ncbi:hypothetical protein QBC33DRAFT_542304 [Phialemonium atrogriseum]|uniref:Secreted protein n=1 Tax=Phialemonium atrogriseum TaxID=1093897 RepID=A0AAJ0FL31_9PEZI|nr:uncharacterized protein QBC33DRAFT_542304 [Phialemonium atrogriseum]KAK1766244.1 hypothetical protein QBC33DRAFT_542304 [Phialemonium atrogriseum]
MLLALRLPSWASLSSWWEHCACTRTGWPKPVMQRLAAKGIFSHQSHGCIYEWQLVDMLFKRKHSKDLARMLRSRRGTAPWYCTYITKGPGSYEVVAAYLTGCWWAWLQQ